MTQPLSSIRGPWCVVTGKHINVVAATGETIAVFGVTGSTVDHINIGNAALAASAPTMLDGLIELQEQIMAAYANETLSWEQCLDQMMDTLSGVFEKIHAEVS